MHLMVIAWWRTTEVLKIEGWDICNSFSCHHFRAAAIKWLWNEKVQPKKQPLKHFPKEKNCFPISTVCWLCNCSDSWKPSSQSRCFQWSKHRCCIWKCVWLFSDAALQTCKKQFPFNAPPWSNELISLTSKFQNVGPFVVKFEGQQKGMWVQQHSQSLWFECLLSLLLWLHFNCVLAFVERTPCFTLKCLEKGLATCLYSLLLLNVMEEKAQNGFSSNPELNGAGHPSNLKNFEETSPRAPIFKDRPLVSSRRYCTYQWINQSSIGVCLSRFVEYLLLVPTRWYRSTLPR